MLYTIQYVISAEDADIVADLHPYILVCSLQAKTHISRNAKDVV